MPKPYLMTRPSGLFARYFVPVVFHRALAARYLVFSLHGERRDAARLRAARIGYLLHHLFEWMRRNPVPDPKDLLATALAGVRAGRELIIDLPDGTRITTDGSAEDYAAAERIMAERARLGVDASNTPATTGAPPASSGAARELMSERAKKHVAYMKSQGLSDTNVLDSTYTLGLFVALLGDKPVGDVLADDIEVFLAALVDYPANASKVKPFRDLAPLDVLAKARETGAKGLSLRTREKHLDRLRSFFGRHVKQRRLPFNPCDGFSVSSKAQDAKRSREAFTSIELEVMASKLTSQVPHQFWAPVLALYTGARVNELGQLMCEDVEQVSDIWGIHIRRDTKNEGSRRFIPLHPELVRLGFLDYVSEATRYGFEHVFPGIHDTVGEPGDTIGDWFNRSFLRKTCAITSPSKVFHSFRHTFATTAERAGVADARIGQLTGHNTNNSVLRGHYIDVATLPDRLRDISKVAYPTFKVAPRKGLMFELYLRRTRASENRGQRLDHERTT